MFRNKKTYKIFHQKLKKIDQNAEPISLFLYMG